MLFEAVFLAAVVGPMLVVLGYGVYAGVRARKMRQLHAPEREALPVFAEGLDIQELRADPDTARARLTGVVVAVNVIATNSFVVDTAGEVHDLELSHDLERVLDNAKWLAGVLDVPFNDGSAHA